MFDVNSVYVTAALIIGSETISDDDISKVYLLYVLDGIFGIPGILGIIAVGLLIYVSCNRFYYIISW